MNAKTIRVQVVDADPSGGQDLPELSVPPGNVLSERFGMDLIKKQSLSSNFTRYSMMLKELSKRYGMSQLLLI